MLSRYDAIRDGHTEFLSGSGFVICPLQLCIIYCVI